MPAEIKLFNEDCLSAMRKMKDKQFDLALVDPPYGIGAGGVGFTNGNTKKLKPHHIAKTTWDNSRPSKDYFIELRRVSCNQIIWGGNYFSDLLPAFRCFVFWDKTTHGNSYADGELAWTSFDSVARYYRENIVHTTLEGRIHPTQKSSKLYKWLLKNYAKEGDKILDTHLGSGSIAIACYDMGYDLTGFEIDKEYYDAAVKRLDNHKKQLTFL